jgi:hypothetical protein
MDSFFSLLNNKELKQVGLPEAYSWMNEGYAIAQNAMNLVNTEYKASEEIILSILPSVSEYLLPDDFSNLLYVRPQDSTLDSQIITPIDLLKIPEYLATGRLSPAITCVGLTWVSSRNLRMRPRIITGTRPSRRNSRLTTTSSTFLTMGTSPSRTSCVIGHTRNFPIRTRRCITRRSRNG